MKYDKLTKKKEQLDHFRPLSNDLVRNLDDWFRVELTYTSNAIEGNTLTRRETALVVEKGLTVGGKVINRTSRGHKSCARAGLGEKTSNTQTYQPITKRYIQYS